MYNMNLKLDRNIVFINVMKRPHAKTIPNSIPKLILYKSGNA